MMATDPILVNSAEKPSTREFNYDNTNYRMALIGTHVRFAVQRLIVEGI